MRFYKTVISNEAPNVKDALWIKPITGGFLINMLEKGGWRPLKLDNGSGAAASYDAAGAADAVGVEVTGTDTDDKTKLTLYGLKAYIQEVEGKIPTE